MDKNIEQFIRAMMHEAGFVDLPEDLADQMVKDIYARLESRLLLMAIKNLDEKDIVEFDRLSATKDEVKIADFLNKKIDKFPEKLQRTLEDFKEEYVSLAKSSKESVKKEIEKSGQSKK